MQPALAFVPVSEVPDAFDDFLEAWPSDPKDLAKYFQVLYIAPSMTNQVHRSSTAQWNTKCRVPAPPGVRA